MTDQNNTNDASMFPTTFGDQSSTTPTSYTQPAFQVVNSAPQIPVQTSQGQQIPVQPQYVQTVQPVNSSEPMNVTSFADLQSFAIGTVVRFPDFAGGQPFVARVRRPSLLALAKQGRIPNTLLASAGELVKGGGSGINSDKDDMLSDIYDICRIICEASLIEPTMQDFEHAGIELSDDQLMAIFSYTQTGVDSLKSFR